MVPFHATIRTREYQGTKDLGCDREEDSRSFRVPCSLWCRRMWFYVPCQNSRHSNQNHIFLCFLPHRAVNFQAKSIIKTTKYLEIPMNDLLLVEVVNTEASLEEVHECLIFGEHLGSSEMAIQRAVFLRIQIELVHAYSNMR